MKRVDKRSRIGVLVAAGVIGLACTGALGQAPIQPGVGADTGPRESARRSGDPGRREYESNCAVCHGKTGRGDGPIVELLKRSPPDLTLLSRRHGGVFPIDRVYQTIEGGVVAAHGPSDMPVWGRDYRIQGAEYYMDVPYDPDLYVRTRLLWLVEYLSRLQRR